MNIGGIKPFIAPPHIVGDDTSALRKRYFFGDITDGPGPHHAAFIQTQGNWHRRNGFLRATSGVGLESANLAALLLYWPHYCDNKSNYMKLETLTGIITTDIADKSQTAISGFFFGKKTESSFYTIGFADGGAILLLDSTQRVVPAGRKAIFQFHARTVGQVVRLEVELKRDALALRITATAYDAFNNNTVLDRVHYKLPPDAMEGIFGLYAGGGDRTWWFKNVEIELEHSATKHFSGPSGFIEPVFSKSNVDTLIYQVNQAFHIPASIEFDIKMKTTHNMKPQPLSWRYDTVKKLLKIPRQAIITPCTLTIIHSADSGYHYTEEWKDIN
jgi:hypothetical protein